jgi:hypothetical protein
MCEKRSKAEKEKEKEKEPNQTAVIPLHDGRNPWYR